MKRQKPKKLNLKEMWELYLLLSPAVNDREPEELAFDEILKIIDLASPQALLASLHIMYDNSIKFTTPLEFNDLFSRGIVKCGFLEFCMIIRGLNGISK